MSAPWEQVEQIFHAALELPNEERESFLREACAGDDALAEEIRSMLRAHTSAGEFLEQPALELHAEILAAEEGALRLGTSLGVYRIVSLLGRGGMGEVYLADDHELGRKVAIKLVRHGFGTDDFVRHLRHEARILASLNDPHIARLYGGAVTPQGVPYFVMEYVEGERLDHFCAERSLTTDERIELFRKVCSAVAHAHQHLIIHRDLKPANIRVTADGEPKLLDFGIAKLLDPETTSGAERTMTLASVMTPDYASPEQARGEAMTTASDVYSLGVILYELLTGEKPYRLTNHRSHEVARVIAQTEAARPSSLRLELAGDLDNILLMALRKEPKRRYSSVGQFSEDLRRYLAGLTVVAHKDTASYRTKKFVRRHRGALAAAALVMLALVGGLVATTWQGRIARLAQRKAETSRKQADHLNQFLEDLLSSADPARMGKDVKVVQVLDAAGKNIDQDLAKEPEVLAQVHETLSRAYQRLQVLPPAEKHARSALAILRRLHGDESLATAQAELRLGSVLLGIFQLKEAEPLLRHALAVQRRQGRPDPFALAETLQTLGGTLSWEHRFREAAPLLAEALPLMRAARGEHSLDYVQVLYSQAYLKHMETEAAAAHNKQPDLDGAIAAYRRVIKLYDQLAPHSTQGIIARFNLCLCLGREKKFAEAERELDQADRDCEQTLGANNLYYLSDTMLRGIFDFVQGKYAKVLEEVRQPLDFYVAHEPPDNRNVVQARGLYGLALTRTGHAAEGEPYLRAAYKDGRKTERFAFAFTFGNVETALGECLLAQNRYAEAEPLLLTGYADLHKRLGPQNPLTAQAAHRLHDLYTAWNKPSQATQFASQLTQTR